MNAEGQISQIRSSSFGIMARAILSSSLFLLALPRASWAFSVSPSSGKRYFTNSLQLSSDTTTSTSCDTHASFISGPGLPPIAPTSKRLFLVRHGEVINPGGDRPVYYGAMDVSLSPLGEQEAQAAARYLQQFDLEYVFSSPLTRAIYGADQILSMQVSNYGKNIVTLEGFLELERGTWCGMTLDEIGPDMMARFDACDESVTPDGGESYPFLKQRVLAARDGVLDMLSPGRSAAIVSHLQVTRSMLSDALSIPTEEMSTLPVATASVTCIDYDTATKQQTVHFQSFKPDAGLVKSKDGAN